jgi:hypothetical protein
VSICPPFRYLGLTSFYPAAVIQTLGKAFALTWLAKIAKAAEESMKVYLLMLLIGTLLTAIHFTAVPERRSETLPQ